MDETTPSPTATTAAPTIVDIALQSGGTFDSDANDFDILVQALIAANLVDVLADPDADFTVFAPTDAAFTQLARTLGVNVTDGDEAGVFDGITVALTELSPSGEPIPLLTDILLYHVAPEGRTLSQLQADGTVLTALEGASVTVEGTAVIDNDPDVADAQFVAAATDIEAANGIVQAIDGVLLPLDVPNAAEAPSAPATISLTELQPVEAGDVVQPSPATVPGAGGGQVVFTFLGETAGFDNAAGYYFYDRATGEIVEGFAAIASSDNSELGSAITIDVPDGLGVVPFIIPDGANLGVDLSQFTAGGLTFSNPETGAPATIFDDASPVVNAFGVATGIVPFHGYDGTPDAANPLNADGLVHATSFEFAGATVFGFEDLLGGGDNDFNDIGVALSTTALDAPVVEVLGDLFDADGGTLSLDMAAQTVAALHDALDQAGEVPPAG